LPAEIFSSLVYLDNAATTQKPIQVIDAITDYYKNHNSNIHRAVHALAEESTEAFEITRSKVAKFLNVANNEEIIFVRGTTEAINLVSYAWGRDNVQKGDIVVTLSPCMSLIKGLAPSISTLMPQMHTSMEDLTSMFGDMLTDSSMSQESMTPTYQGNTDTDAILQEAHNVIEGKTKTAMPEPPTTSLQHFSKEKESMI